MTTFRPYLIGIAGLSGSGKSMLAERLTEVLAPRVAILSMDWYYHDLSSCPAPARAHQNFDAPEAIDLPLLRYHVRELAAGHAIDAPVYHFDTHTRSSWTRHVPPAPWVVVEGLFALYWDDLRDMYETSVFIDAEDDLCLSRRIKRDSSQRSRTPESIIEQYHQTVRPMAQLYVLPTRRLADVTIDASWPPDRGAHFLLSQVLGSLRHRRDRVA